MPDSDQKHADDARPTLDYRAGRDDAPLRSAMVLLGVFVGVAGVLGSVFVSAFAAYASGSSWPLLIIVGAVGALAALGLATRRSISQRGLSIGVWIGLGIGALIEGICFGGGFLR